MCILQTPTITRSRNPLLDLSDLTELAEKKKVLLHNRRRRTARGVANQTLIHPGDDDGGGGVGRRGCPLVLSGDGGTKGREKKGRKRGYLLVKCSSYQGEGVLVILSRGTLVLSGGGGAKLYAPGPVQVWLFPRQDQVLSCVLIQGTSFPMFCPLVLSGEPPSGQDLPLIRLR